MKYNSILEQIHNTPHVRINRLFPGPHEVWIKTERTNPGGSIKDRIALAMIEEAERSGALESGGVIIEPTSGNTGIGLSMVGAVKGYRVIIVMPDSLSVERRGLVAAYGAELVLTPASDGIAGSIQRAQEIATDTPGAWIPMQFENPANPAVHVRHTAEEIAADFPDGLDFVITGVGTGGHITGIARVLKERYRALQVIAVEPAGSPVLSGGEPGSHRIQGIGAGFVPAVVQRELIDDVVLVDNDDAFTFARRAAREEGVLVGISTGASLAATATVLAGQETPRRVLTFNYDTGERYLSVEGFLP